MTVAVSREGTVHGVRCRARCRVRDGPVRPHLQTACGVQNWPQPEVSGSPFQVGCHEARLKSDLTDPRDQFDAGFRVPFNDLMSPPHGFRKVRKVIEGFYINYQVLRLSRSLHALISFHCPRVPFLTFR